MWSWERGSNMLWIVAILIIMLGLSLWYNFQTYKTNEFLLEYWRKNENKMWLDDLEKSGCIMIDVRK